jgi:hypothetical protein
MSSYFLTTPFISHNSSPCFLKSAKIILQAGRPLRPTGRPKNRALRNRDTNVLLKYPKRGDGLMPLCAVGRNMVGAPRNVGATIIAHRPRPNRARAGIVLDVHSWVLYGNQDPATVAGSTLIGPEPITTSLVSTRTEGLYPVGFDEPEHQILQQPHQYLPVNRWQRRVPDR